MCAGGLVGCSSSASGPTTVAPKPDVVITAVNGVVWDAKAYTVKSTDGKVVIQGRNESSLPHNLYIIGSDGIENPSSLDLPSRGRVATETATLQPGTYTVICKIPGHTNMKATLTVT